MTEHEPLPPKHSLNGWSAIENYVQKHDSGMVKDYADDIDTLLVFAGLFSAVLTAFVVESYTMLQLDNTQTTNNLLTGISTQLQSIQRTGSTKISNSSESAGQSFNPSTSVRWINCLFFLSLVSSLAAALFGILAKQWLREYMKWNSTLGVPRENILIRQIRFEAWEAWHVAATISSIPVLLESAMILFLVGIVILLWTLDAVVAVVVTAAVALFLGAVAAFTILPVFFKRCPYKSPSAWACVMLCDVVSDAIAYSIRFFTEYVRNIRYKYWNISAVDVQWSSRPKSWRERGEGAFTGDQANFCGSSEETRSLLYVVESALVAKKAGSSDDEFSRGPVADKSNLRSLTQAALRDLHEVAVLFRALSWVYKASQDLRVRAHVAQSMSNIHSTLPNAFDSRGVANLSDWCILACLQEGNLQHPEHALLPSGKDSQRGLAVIQTNIREMWLRHSIHVFGEQRSVTRIRQRVQYGFFNLRVPQDYAPLLALLVDADLQSTLCTLEAMASDTTKPPIPSSAGRFIVELLCVLGSLYFRQDIPLSDRHLHGFRYMVCNRSIKRLLDMNWPGLRSSAFILACRLANVESCNGNLTVTTEGKHMDSLAYGSLVLDYFASDIHDYGPEDLHIFVLLTNEWILLRTLGTDPSEIFTPGVASVPGIISILNKMAEAAEFSLRASLHNCGCYYDLPWISSLWSTRTQHLSDSNSLYRHHAYLRLLHTMDKLCTRGLITGPDAELLPELLRVAHESHPAPCGDLDCQSVNRREPELPSNERDLGRDTQAPFEEPVAQNGPAYTSLMTAAYNLHLTPGGNAASPLESLSLPHSSRR